MTKVNTENKYANACNTVNKLMDNLFGLFGCGDATTYHITEDDVRKALGDLDSKEDVHEQTKAENEQALIDEYKEKYGLDLTDFVTTINEMVEKYTNNTAVEDASAETTTGCDCEGCPCAEDCDCGDCCTEDDVIEFDCDGDCGNCDFGQDCLDMYEDMLEYENPSKEHCESVMDRLKSELADYKAETADDNVEAYSYEQMLFDINSILDDPDSGDYEFIVEPGKKDVVKVTYHVGYEGKEAYHALVNYARNLDKDLQNMYGFSNVYISSDNNEDDEYVTFYIFMEI